MNGNTHRGHSIRFSVFELDLDSGELFAQGGKVKLQGQPFQLLVALLERPGEVISREELRQRIWPGDTLVDFEHGLNRAINKARKALRDSAQTPQFLETLSKRGYRFIGSIHRESGKGSTSKIKALKEPILIGRGAKRDQLLGLIDAAFSGRGSLALLGGEPGIGKTHVALPMLAEGLRRG